MDYKIKEILFADLDGTLIETVSGERFPRGIWDMKLRLDVLYKIFTMFPNLRCLFIVTNQGGIEKGFIDRDNFAAKFSYVRAAAKEFLGVQVGGNWCESCDDTCWKRKPNVGMLSLGMLSVNKLFGNEFDKSQVAMIGDASGKPNQFSDSDKRTAENFGIDYIDVDDFLAFTK